jgi:hypothetical protein
MGKWLWRAWLAVVAVVVGWVGFVVFQSHAGPRHAVTAATPAPAHPVAHRPGCGVRVRPTSQLVRHNGHPEPGCHQRISNRA